MLELLEAVIVAMLVAAGFVVLLAALSLVRHIILNANPDAKRYRWLEREEHRDRYGILYSAPSRYGRIKWVQVYDEHAGETHRIPVPRYLFRAHQAVAWTYYSHEEYFNPTRV
jgi:hypothetical protein